MILPTRRPSGRTFMVALSLLAMVGPFATDMYLPGFPVIAADLRAAPSVVQLTLTTFFLGAATGQVVFGPASDRWGRRRPLLAGAALCVVASIACALAPTAHVLLAARSVQGFGAAAGMVISRAIVADVRTGAAAARTLSLLMMLMSVAPVVAPMLGGLLLAPLGWRGVLWVLVGCTVIALVAAVLAIPETHVRTPPRRRSAPSASPGDTGPAGPYLRGTDRRAPVPGRPGVGGLIRRPSFLAHALVAPCAFSALMAYVSASPFVFQSMMGLSVAASGVLFAVNSAAILVGNGINARYVGRVGQHRMLGIGVGILAVGAGGLLVSVGLSLPAWTLEPALFALTASAGLVFGNTVALALGHAADARGSGSALIGAAQFVAGAAVAPIVGLRGPHSALPLTVVAVGAGVACALLVRWGARLRGAPRAA